MQQIQWPKIKIFLKRKSYIFKYKIHALKNIL